MLPNPSCDVTPGLRGEGRIREMIMKQRDWIKWCEANRESYSGPQGSAIREADLKALRGLESELAYYTGGGTMEKRCENVHQVTRELDLWMNHYLKWAANDKIVTSEGKERWRKKAEACERARDIMAAEFGEPGEAGE